MRYDSRKMKKLKHKASIRQMDNKDRLNKKSYQIDCVRTVFGFETYVLEQIDTNQKKVRPNAGNLSKKMLCTVCIPSTPCVL
jgi:hypothetical protein